MIGNNLPGNINPGSEVATQQQYTGAALLLARLIRPVFNLSVPRRKKIGFSLDDREKSEYIYFVLQSTLLLFTLALEV
jgi:hypothetical protein